MQSSVLQRIIEVSHDNISNYAVFIAIHDAYKFKPYYSLNGTEFSWDVLSCKFVPNNHFIFVPNNQFVA